MFKLSWSVIFKFDNLCQPTFPSTQNDLTRVAFFYGTPSILTVMACMATWGSACWSLLVMDLRQSLGPSRLAVTRSQKSIMRPQSSFVFFGVSDFLYKRSHMSVISDLKLAKLDLPTSPSKGEEVLKRPMVLQTTNLPEFGNKEGSWNYFLFNFLSTSFCFYLFFKASINSRN